MRVRVRVGCMRRAAPRRAAFVRCGGCDAGRCGVLPIPRSLLLNDANLSSTENAILDLVSDPATFQDGAWRLVRNRRLVHRFMFLRVELFAGGVELDHAVALEGVEQTLGGEFYAVVEVHERPFRIGRLEVLSACSQFFGNGSEREVQDV